MRWKSCLLAVAMAMGLGAVMGGLFIAHRSKPTPKLMATLATGFGVFLVLVAFSPSLVWAELMLVPTGAFGIAFISTCNATLQLNSNQEMRGRVMSLYGTAFMGSTPIGAPLMGLIIGASSPRLGLMLGACTTLVIGAWLIFTHDQNVASTEALRVA